MTKLWNMNKMKIETKLLVINNLVEFKLYRSSNFVFI